MFLLFELNSYNVIFPKLVESNIILSVILSCVISLFILKGPQLD